MRSVLLVAAPLLLVVGAAWAGGGGASPAQVNDPSADPLPITHLIHVVSKDTGDTAIWYAQGPDILFPHQSFPLLAVHIILVLLFFLTQPRT